MLVCARVSLLSCRLSVYTGVGLNTEVNIKDRPVTREGMVGIAPGAMGPGRQVVDASYYVGKLRQKTVELQTEIDKMKAEEEQYHKNSSTYQQVRALLGMPQASGMRVRAGAQAEQLPRWSHCRDPSYGPLTPTHAHPEPLCCCPTSTSASMRR